MTRREWGAEPGWMHDMRQLESAVGDALTAKGFAPARFEGREGWDHIVQSGFRTHIEGPDQISVVWTPAYNVVVTPNERRDKRIAMADALASGGFDAETSAGSSEVRVRPR